MVLRLHRLTEEQWHRLAASRRAQDLGDAPPRSAIGAIEIQLRSLEQLEKIEKLEPFPESDEPRTAAAG